MASPEGGAGFRESVIASLMGAYLLHLDWFDNDP
jgi:hypothetical protein